MKLLRVLLLSLLPLTSYADPAAFVGISYAFGTGSNGFGIGAKVLSDDKDGHVVAALGATYYPFAAKKLGVDVGAGYAKSDAAVIVSWDFLQEAVQLSAGWADLESDRSDDPAPAPVAPAPLPPALPPAAE